jgi:predicted dehydrogenase
MVRAERSRNLTLMVLRWGILAAGSIARVFAKDLAIVDPTRNAHRITSVASRDLVRAAQFASDFDIPYSYGSYSEVLDSDEVDIVYVANVQSAHHDVVLSALHAGKHVLCEKPLALNLREVDEMFALARARNLFLMEAMWTRFLPHIREILKLIDEGAIGRPRFVIADHGQWVYRKRDHRLLDPDQGGGALLDLGIYPITLAHLILGVPDEIKASASFTDRGVDSEVSMALHYSGGRSATLHTTIESVTATRATVAGDDGRIDIDRSFYSPAGFTLHRHDGKELRYENPLKIPGYVGLGEQLREVARAIAAGETQSPLRTHKDTREVMEIMEKIRVEIGLSYPSEIRNANDSGRIS